MGRGRGFALAVTGILVLFALIAGCNEESTSPDTFPPTRINDLQASAISDSEARLTWTSTGDDGLDGVASRYAVRFSMGDSSVVEWADSSSSAVSSCPKPRRSGEPDTLVVADLEGMTRYFFAMRVCDEAGNWSLTSNVAPCSMPVGPDLIPPGAITSLRIAEVDCTSMLLTWTAPGDDSTTGRVAAYDLRRSTGPCSGTSWWATGDTCLAPAPHGGGYTEEQRIRDLVPDTDYCFALASVDEAGNCSALSNVVSERTHYLPPSVLILPDGSGTFSTIKDAVDYLPTGVTIELGDGRFTGAGNRDVDFKGKSLVIRSRSGDPTACIVDCEGHGPAFYLHSGEDSATTIEGLTISSGVAERVGFYNDKCGGALLLTTSASPIIRNCVFRENRASGSGGAVFCVDFANAHFYNCVFADNTADKAGGAISACWSKNVFMDCVFTSNRAATHGGAISSWCETYCESAPEITSCTFAYNAAPQGAGVWADGSKGCPASLRRTIIAYSLLGSAVLVRQPYLSCTDLFGNAGGDWTDDILEQLGMYGNMAADPCFCDPQAGDFRLRNESPCSADSTDCGQIGALATGCE